MVTGCRGYSRSRHGHGVPWLQPEQMRLFARFHRMMKKERQHPVSAI